MLFNKLCNTVNNRILSLKKIEKPILAVFPLIAGIFDIV